MVFQGSLHEYVLIDIFKLLASQNGSGALQLLDGNKEGIVFFKKGAIIGATSSDEQFAGKLFYLLADTFQYPVPEARRLFASVEDNETALCSEIVRKRLIPLKVLESFAASVIEDISCGFFLWAQGTYHFSTVFPMDSSGVAPGWLKLAAEKVTMEATRRMDEWRRMERLIDKDAVFAQVNGYDRNVVTRTDSGFSPSAIMLSRIDGTSSVDAIIQSSCLTKYKAYEAIKNLLEKNQIRPVSQRRRKSSSRRHERPERRRRSIALRPRIPAIPGLFACAFMVILFLGLFVLHGTLLFDLDSAAACARLDAQALDEGQKMTISSLQYHALYGVAPDGPQDLENESLLSKADLRALRTLQSIDALTQGTFGIMKRLSLLLPLP